MKPYFSYNKKYRFHDIVCGLRSNIPACCIRFWLDAYLQMSSYDQDSYFQKVSNSPFSYIPCPSCFENKIVNKLILCENSNSCADNPTCYERTDDVTTFKFRDKTEESQVKGLLVESQGKQSSEREDSTREG